MSLCLSCHGLSADMEHYLPGALIRSSQIDLTSCQIFMLTTWGQNKYVSMRLDVMNTRYLSFSTNFRSLKGQNDHNTKKQNYCLTYPERDTLRPKIVKLGIV